MKLTKRGLDKGIHLGVAVWTAVSPLLVEQHVISANLSLDLGVALATALGSYHGGAAAQKRIATPHVRELA